MLNELKKNIKNMRNKKIELQKYIEELEQEIEKQCSKLHNECLKLHKNHNFVTNYENEIYGGYNCVCLECGYIGDSRTY